MRIFAQRLVPVLLLAFLASPAVADEVTLSEPFKPDSTTRVEVQVKISGKLTLPPTGKDNSPRQATVTGTSKLMYEERLLQADEATMLKSVRGYREVAFERTIGDLKQDAGIRPSVRRMIVIKSGARRAPFSPDGPLMWGEIDLVRTDVFNPALIPGLLPSTPVKPGESWVASAAAVAELTDMEKVDEGRLTVEFVGATKVGEKRVARLKLSGTVRGVNEDGPSRQKLEGTGYFDLDGGILTYLSVKGTKELLDGKGQTVGLIEGQFALRRSTVEKIPGDLSDASLRDLDLKPTPENTLLLYDNTDLGVRFLYPRGWRVGAVQGQQLTLDHARGGGILITVEAPTRVPTVDAYLSEVRTFLEKQKATVANSEKPTRLRAVPVQLDRFTFDATIGKNELRLEYAVLNQGDGGATIAATLPANDKEIRADLSRIIRSLSLTKPIEEKK
jgi:hypothetical protein